MPAQVNSLTRKLKEMLRREKKDVRCTVEPLGVPTTKPLNY
jgi:hypothetical protein